MFVSVLTSVFILSVFVSAYPSHLGDHLRQRLLGDLRDDGGVGGVGDDLLDAAWGLVQELVHKLLAYAV